MPIPAILAALASEMGIAVAAEGAAVSGAAATGGSAAAAGGSTAVAAGGAARAAGGSKWLQSVMSGLNKTPKGLPETAAAELPTGAPASAEGLAQKAGKPTADGMKNPAPLKDKATKDASTQNPEGLPGSDNGKGPPKSPFDNQFVDGGGEGGNGGGGGGSGGNGGGGGGEKQPKKNPVDPESNVPGLEKIKDFFEKSPALDGATKVLNQGTRIMNDDYVGFLNSFDAIPDPLKRLVTAFDDASKAIINRTRELAPWNAQLTGATVNRDLDLMKSDIYEANTNADSYSRLTNEYTQFEVFLRETFAPMKDSLANLLASVLEMVNLMQQFSVVPEAIVVVSTMAKLIADILSGNFSKAWEHLQEFPERLGDAIFRRSKKNDPTGAEQIWANTIDMMINKRRPGEFQKPDANQPLGFDLING